MELSNLPTPVCTCSLIIIGSSFEEILEIQVFACLKYLVVACLYCQHKAENLTKLDSFCTLCDQNIIIILHAAQIICHTIFVTYALFVYTFVDP